MNYCSKCTKHFYGHRFIVDNEVYCSPGCFTSDRHTGWIGRVYRTLDATPGITTVRLCKDDPCCEKPRPWRNKPKRRPRRRRR